MSRLQIVWGAPPAPPPTLPHGLSQATRLQRLVSTKKMLYWMFQAPKKAPKRKKKNMHKRQRRLQSERCCLSGGAGQVHDPNFFVAAALLFKLHGALRRKSREWCWGRGRGMGLGNGSRHKDGWCMLRFQFGAAGHLFFGDGAPSSSQLSVTCLGSQRTRNRFTGANSPPRVGNADVEEAGDGGATAIERLPFVFAPQPAGFSPRLTPFYYFAVAVVWS